VIMNEVARPTTSRIVVNAAGHCSSDFRMLA
jgi:hypothetical protein